MTSESRPAPALPDSDEPTVTLEEIDIRAELRSRPRRAPSYEAEDRAVAVLAREMADNPRNMLQKLVEMALELCRAETAGISILEGDVFRWEAVAGVFAPYRNLTTPRAASPCGVCIDQNLTQLLRLPDRHFPALRAHPRVVEALLVPFHCHGKPVGTVSVVAHNDERKFDSEDERILRTLGQFAAAGWQLWKSYAAADESNRHKDEFLAILGHELRNPLAAIVSATTLLRRFVTGEVQTYALDVLARQSRQLSRIVDDLLDVSRLTQDKLDLRMDVIELRTVVADAVETTQTQIERRGHRLSVDLPSAPAWLNADPARVAQLLANLLDNAAKYTPDGGQIWLTAELTEAQVTITVRDTGRGIARKDLATIFELFAQSGGRVGDHREGLGLGLTLVRRLTEMHGGSVQAESDGPGKGSRFTVRLPLASPPAETARPIAGPRQLEAPMRRRILLVEDNEDVAKSLAMTLSLEGHTVKIAPDGPAALEAVKAFVPNIVLLDVGLPGMSGYHVARQIRAVTAPGDLVIIAVTGYGRGEDRELSQQAGCDAHLVKPVDSDALRAVLGRF